MTGHSKEVFRGWGLTRGLGIERHRRSAGRGSQLAWYEFDFANTFGASRLAARRGRLSDTEHAEVVSRVGWMGSRRTRLPGEALTAGPGVLACGQTVCRAVIDHAEPAHRSGARGGENPLPSHPLAPCWQGSVAAAPNGMF